MARMVRKRVGIVALSLLVWNGLVNIWDWATRLSGLDPYFGVKQDTTGGHLLNLALSPPIFFILALIFGILWCYEPYLEKLVAKKSLRESGGPIATTAATDVQDAPVESETEASQTMTKRDTPVPPPVERPQNLKRELVMFSQDMKRIAKRAEQGPGNPFEIATTAFQAELSGWYGMIKDKIGKLLHNMTQDNLTKYRTLLFTTPAGPANLRKIADILESLSLEINSDIPPTDHWL